MKISARFLPPLHTARENLFKRMVRLYSGEPLAAPFLSLEFHQLSLAMIKSVAMRISPQCSAALARILCGGLSQKRLPNRHGNCPFLLQHHTGTLSCQHAWLRQSVPTILFDLIASSSLAPLSGGGLFQKVASTAYLRQIRLRRAGRQR